MRKKRIRQASDKLRQRIQNALTRSMGACPGGSLDFQDQRASIVLLLLGEAPPDTPQAGRACVILTKRSQRVRQPGDLCCPGGGIHPRADRLLGTLIGAAAPFLSWWEGDPFWPSGCGNGGIAYGRMFATGLRESFEEIRLNPLRVRPLGTLPLQRLVMYGRTIHPVVGWMQGQQRFRPNWEVAEVQFLPLADLRDPQAYARLQFVPEKGPGGVPGPALGQYFPCFVTRQTNGQEVLWGATFRIVMDFLARVFDFRAPEMDALPIVRRVMPARYLNP